MQVLSCMGFSCRQVVEFGETEEVQYAHASAVSSYAILPKSVSLDSDDVHTTYTYYIHRCALE